MDYSNSQLVTLDTGEGRIQTGSFKLIHTIDLQKYAEIVDQIEATMSRQFNNNHTLYPHLSHTINRIKISLHRLSPITKQKRSLDFIGSAWKWVAGNPDHHDFEIINEKINKVLANNNNQVIINNLEEERINNVTKLANSILKIVQTDGKYKNEELINVKYKLDLIKEEIVNVEYAIHWAKANIVNSFILSNVEIGIITNVLEKENLPYLNVEQALEFADIKIATSKKGIIYIISLPTTDVEPCQTLIIKAIKRDNIINKIPFNLILKCNKKIYGMKNNCKTGNGFRICPSNSVIDISDTNCIPKLLNSLPPTCTVMNNQHVPEIEEILPGAIFLNQFKGNVTINNETVELNGAFLIRYQNTTVKINNRFFTSREVANYKPLPPVLQHASAKNEIEEVLSLEMMKELHLNNTKYIELLDTKNNISAAINFSFTLLLLVTIIIVLLILKCWKRTQSLRLETVISNARDPEQTEMNHCGPLPQRHLQRPLSINSIPYF